MSENFPGTAPEKTPENPKLERELAYPDSKIQNDIVKRIWPAEVLDGLDQKSLVLTQIAKGYVDDESFREAILSKMELPLDKEKNPKDLSTLLGELDKQGKGLIAWSVRGDFKKREELKPRDLGLFMVMYYDPVEFDAVRKEFLGVVSGPQKQAEYKKALWEMATIIYGKEQAYWDQFCLMKEQAETDPTYQEFVEERKEREKRQRNKGKAKKRVHFPASKTLREFIKSLDLEVASSEGIPPKTQEKIKERKSEMAVRMVRIAGGEGIIIRKTPEEINKEAEELFSRTARGGWLKPTESK